jgi:hypothetical protein
MAINKAINIPIFGWLTQLDQAEKVTEELEQLTRHQQLISKAIGSKVVSPGETTLDGDWIQ